MPRPDKAWSSRWLKIDCNHPQLEILEAQLCEFCRQLYRTPLSGWLLMIHGPNGTVKTHAVKSVHAWASQVGRSIPLIRGLDIVGFVESMYCYWPKLIDEMRRGAWDIIDRAFERELVILDDVGSEYDPNRLAVDKFCQILSMRENRWTIVTSNIGPEDWHKRFDRRIVSRLLRNSVLVDLSDVPDYSTQILERSVANRVG